MSRPSRPLAPPVGGAVGEQLRFETLLADLSVGLGGVAPGQLDAAIEAAQQSVCECLDLDRSALWQADPEVAGELRLTHLYERPSGPLAMTEDGAPARDEPPHLGASLRDRFPWVLRQAALGRPVVIATVGDLPAEADVDRASFRSFGYRSGVAVPLSHDGGLIGLLTFVDVCGERQRPPELVNRLALVGHLFTNSLQRRRHEEAMRRNEARLAGAVDLAELGFYDTHIGGEHLIFIDDRLRSMVGAQNVAADAALEFWEAGLHEADRDRVLTMQETLWSGECESLSVEYRFVHPSRGTVWLSHAARVLQRDTRGRAVRLMGVVQDITERKRGQQELEEQLRFETTLSELSAQFVNLPAAQVDAVILEAQKSICECLGFDLSALWQWSADNPVSQSLTHLYRRHPGPPAPHLMDAREYFPWCLAELTAGRTISIASVDEAPPEAARDVEVWHHYGVRSSLTIPLSTGGGPTLGSLNFATVAAERQFPERLVQRIRLIAAVFANALNRKIAEERLRDSFAEVKRLQSRIEQENLYLRTEHQLLYGHGRIVGESRAITEVLAAVEQVAPLHSTVLLEGETGVGKELVARRIHELSPRSGRPLVKVNCAALPSTLVESELYGREKGAYTGAVSREAGRFEIAHGSTILLDEVGELPLELQAKLLRVLEEGEFERVGSSRTLRTDARVIAATNRDLAAEVAAGRFRRDLYYRLSAFPIRVPPLRERREDIPLLMWAIIEEFAAAMHKEVKAVPRRAIDALRLHDWPGNVRELRNVVERAMIRANGPTLVVDVPGAPLADRDAPASLDDAQRRHIEKVLAAAGGRISGPGGAAELLGVKRTTLNSLMKRLGVERRPAAGRAHH